MRNKNKLLHRLWRPSANLAILVCAAYFIVLLFPKTFADMWPPSGEISRWSRDRRFQATSYSTNETMVFQRDPFRLLWKLPRGFCMFDVSNDGNAIVAATYLLPLDAHDNDVVLTFVLRGKVIREITVKQLLGSVSKLQRITPQPGGLCVPASGTEFLSWGRGLGGIDENGFALVDTVVGFFIFDAETAKCVFPAGNHIDLAGTH